MMKITIKLSKILDSKLSKLSKEVKQPKDTLIIEAIKNYLEDWEECVRARKIAENPGKIYTLEEVMERLKLDD